MRRLLPIVWMMALPALATAQQPSDEWETERFTLERNHVRWKLDVAWKPTAAKDQKVSTRITLRRGEASSPITVFDGLAAVDPHHGPVVMASDEVTHIALCGTDPGPAGCSCILTFDEQNIDFHGCWTDGALSPVLFIAQADDHQLVQQLSTWLRKGPQGKTAQRSAALVIAFRDSARRAVQQGNYRAARSLLTALTRVDWPKSDGTRVCVAKPAEWDHAANRCASLPPDFSPVVLAELGELMLLNGLKEPARKMLGGLEKLNASADLVLRLEAALGK